MEALIFLAVFLFVYFAPCLIGGWRNHPNQVAIGVLNLFAGWTFIGWIVALVWAFSAIPAQQDEN